MPRLRLSQECDQRALNLFPFCNIWRCDVQIALHTVPRRRHTDVLRHELPRVRTPKFIWWHAVPTLTRMRIEKGVDSLPSVGGRTHALRGQVHSSRPSRRRVLSPFDLTIQLLRGGAFGLRIFPTKLFFGFSSFRIIHAFPER